MAAQDSRSLSKLESDMLQALIWSRRALVATVQYIPLDSCYMEHRTVLNTLDLVDKALAGFAKQDPMARTLLGHLLTESILRSVAPKASD